MGARKTGLSPAYGRSLPLTPRPSLPGRHSHSLRRCLPYTRAKNEEDTILDPGRKEKRERERQLHNASCEMHSPYIQQCSIYKGPREV